MNTTPTDHLEQQNHPESQPSQKQKSTTFSDGAFQKYLERFKVSESDGCEFGCEQTDSARHTHKISKTQFNLKNHLFWKWKRIRGRLILLRINHTNISHEFLIKKEDASGFHSIKKHAHKPGDAQFRQIKDCEWKVLRTAHGWRLFGQCTRGWNTIRSFHQPNKTRVFLTCVHHFMSFDEIWYCECGCVFQINGPFIFLHVCQHVRCACKDIVLTNKHQSLGALRASSAFTADPRNSKWFH